jgi:uncharacterized protein (TIGR00304 family)
MATKKLMRADILILGFVLLALGMLVIAYGMYKSVRESGGRAEGGGVIVIGPFPIAFGTSETITKVMAILGIVIVLVFVLLAFLSLGKIT